MVWRALVTPCSIMAPDHLGQAFDEATDLIDRGNASFRPVPWRWHRPRGMIEMVHQCHRFVIELAHLLNQPDGRLLGFIDYTGGR